MQKNLFGKYNPLRDEAGHLFLGSISLFPFYITGIITFENCLLLFLLGICLDLDHFLNPVIARALKIPGTIIASKKQMGFTIKILHGLDLAAIISILYYLFSNDLVISIGLWISLAIHEIWDFIVYNHTWKELFLFTRASCKFRPGKRKHLTGLIFESNTLPM